ncbi:MAG: transcription antitermination factor NusB [Eubacteriales bacterium]
MKRSKIRELIMQLLFQMEVQKDFSKEAIDKFIEINFEDNSEVGFFVDTLTAIVDKIVEIDSVIEEYSDNWKISRIAQVDLAVLRLAICEIKYIKDIPTSASINEAVELAKKFGGANSSKFVNGVLGKIARENEQQ